MSPPKSKTKSCNSFHNFLLLPKELQISIWQYAILPQIISLAPTPPPALFSVCHLSRSISRPLYKEVWQSGPYVPRNRMMEPETGRARTKTKSKKKNEKDHIPYVPHFCLFVNLKLDHLYLTPLSQLPDTSDKNSLVTRSLDRLLVARDPGYRNFQALRRVHKCVTDQNLLLNIRGLVLDLEERGSWQRGYAWGAGDWWWRNFWGQFGVDFPAVESVVFVPEVMCVVPGELEAKAARRQKKVVGRVREAFESVWSEGTGVSEEKALGDERRVWFSIMGIETTLKESDGKSNRVFSRLKKWTTL